MGRLGGGRWHRTVPVWKWAETRGAEHIPSLLLVLQAGLRVGVDMVQVSGFEKPQQRVPLLSLWSRFQAAIAALAPHPRPTPPWDLDLTSHLTVGLPSARALPGDLDRGWPWLLASDLLCCPGLGTTGLHPRQCGHCPCPFSPPPDPQHLPLQSC